MAWSKTSWKSLTPALQKAYASIGQRNWDNATNENSEAALIQKAMTSTSSKGAAKVADNVTGEGAGVAKLQALVAEWKKLQELTQSVAAGTAGGQFAGMALDLLEEEATIRRGIVKDLGQTGLLQQRTTKEIFKASVATSQYGILQEDLLATLTSISDVVGRNIAFTDEEIERLAVFQKAFELSGDQVGKMVKQFDQMGFTIDTSIDKANEMADVARMMGVNMEGFMDNMTQNMDMLNTYNFADGVKGFAKMAAQSERLGISMGTTAKLAEQVMDPEGAIELAANLQVIGGAVGDLADPFKLMYMATNDLGGLQDALVDAGKSLTYFNEETGEISFPPTAQRQLRAMADALGMSKEEFAGMIKMQAKFEAASNQMNLSSFVGKDADEMKEFVASMAKMGEKGIYQIELEDKTGNKEMVNLSDLTKVQVDELRKLREQQEMTEKDVALEQLSLLDAIKNNTSVMPKQALKAGLIEKLDVGAVHMTLTEGVNAAIDNESVKAIGDAVGEQMRKGIEMMTGRDYDEVKEGIKKGTNVTQAGVKAGLQTISELITTSTNTTVNADKVVVYGNIEAQPETDFMMPADGKPKLILGGPDGAIISAADDTISGYKGGGGALGSAAGSVSAGGGQQTIALKLEGMSSLPITLKGVGELANVNIIDKLLNGPNRELFLQKLSYALNETNPTGTQDYAQLQSVGLESRG